MKGRKVVATRTRGCIRATSHRGGGLANHLAWRLPIFAVAWLWLLLCAPGCATVPTVKPVAPVAPVSGGGSRVYLENGARRALVHLDVWKAGKDKPEPGTAFAVAQTERAAYLLTALHVIESEQSQVTRVRLTGASAMGVPGCPEFAF